MDLLLRLYKTNSYVASPHGRRVVYYEPVHNLTFIKNGDWIQYDCDKNWTEIKPTELGIYFGRNNHNVGMMCDKI